MKSRIKWSLSRYPFLFIPLYRLTAPPSHRDLLITSETQIVIEGFPRSGNTFAVVAFEMAQDHRIKIAHHLHVEAQIIEGVRRSIPVIVLIRNPMDAIRSYHIRHPEVKLIWAFKRYISFYKAVDSVSKEVVLAQFDNVILNYGGVIQRVNLKYGKRFSVFEHNEKNTNLVFKRIETLNNLIDSGKISHLAMPNEERREVYKNMILKVPAYLKNQALDVYQSLINSSLKG